MLKCGFNKVEIALRHRCFPVNLLHIFRTPIPKNTIEGCFWSEKNISYFANYQNFAIIIFIYFLSVDCTERGGYCSGRGTCVGNYFNHKCICEFGYIPTNDDAPDCVKGISS